MTITPKTVLYAEDDENDLFLMERAFDRLKIANTLRNVPDGKAAIAYLSGETPYENRAENPFPSLVLLDLSLPGRHGLEVLKWIKSQPPLASLPVVVLTSSNQERDVHRAYLLGASGYLIKPGDPNQLLRIVKSLQDYWLGDVTPKGPFIEFAPAGNVPRPKGEASATQPVIGSDPV